MLEGNDWLSNAYWSRVSMRPGVSVEGFTLMARMGSCNNPCLNDKKDKAWKTSSSIQQEQNQDLKTSRTMLAIKISQSPLRCRALGTYIGARKRLGSKRSILVACLPVENVST